MLTPDNQFLIDNVDYLKKIKVKYEKGRQRGKIFSTPDPDISLDIKEQSSYEEDSFTDQSQDSELKR